LIKEAFMDQNIVFEDRVEWQPHPKFKGVEIKPFFTEKVHKSQASIVLVRTKKGEEIPEHIHEESDDIFYVLSGKGKEFIEGSGEFVLQKGMGVRIPKGLKHRTYDVEEDLIFYGVFAPPTM
jgi:quercetin dioxygenase-like cupin family protein